jgi:hypothetical protein
MAERVEKVANGFNSPEVAQRLPRVIGYWNQATKMGLENIQGRTFPANFK